MSHNGNRSVAAALAVAVVCACAVSARAAFVDGVEHFTGTSVDQGTWARYWFGQGETTVSDGYLDISGQSYLTTRDLTVGVGDTISARVMFTEASEFGTVLYLGLTETPAEPFRGHRAFVSLLNSSQGDSSFTFFSGSSATGGASGTPNPMAHNVGQWYRMQLRRTSPTDYTSELFTDEGVRLFRLNNTYAGLPDRASVFIGLGPTARFDWVAVPEPAGACGLALGGCLLLRRGRLKRGRQPIRFFMSGG